MLKQSDFIYYLKISFCSLHTEATSSGLWENVKLIKYIYRILTKDGTTEMGSRVCGSCMVWYGSLGMAPPHGIHTNKKYVPPTVVVVRRRVGVLIGLDEKVGLGLQVVTWGEELECPTVCDLICVAVVIYPRSCLLKGHFHGWSWPPQCFLYLPVIPCVLWWSSLDWPDVLSCSCVGGWGMRPWGFPLPCPLKFCQILQCVFIHWRIWQNIRRQGKGTHQGSIHQHSNNTGCLVSHDCFTIVHRKIQETLRRPCSSV